MAAILDYGGAQRLEAPSYYESVASLLQADFARVGIAITELYAQRMVLFSHLQLPRFGVSPVGYREVHLATLYDMQVSTEQED